MSERFVKKLTFILFCQSLRANKMNLGTEFDVSPKKYLYDAINNKCNGILRKASSFILKKGESVNCAIDISVLLSHRDIWRSMVWCYIYTHHHTYHSNTSILTLYEECHYFP